MEDLPAVAKGKIRSKMSELFAAHTAQQRQQLVKQHKAQQLERAHGYDSLRGLDHLLLLADKPLADFEPDSKAEFLERISEPLRKGETRSTKPAPDNAFPYELPEDLIRQPLYIPHNWPAGWLGGWG